jgi:isochorismate synthase
MCSIAIGTTSPYPGLRQDYQRMLRPLLQEAMQRARVTQHAILASLTVPLADFDAIHAYSAARLAGLGECFFWEQATASNALVGAGTALTLETQGASRFVDAARRWHELVDDALIMTIDPQPKRLSAHPYGPILFGGFAFDPSRPRTPLWSAFPDGLLTLPSLLLRRHNGETTLTVSSMIEASGDVEQCAATLAESVECLLDAVDGTFLQPPDPETIYSSYALTLHDTLPTSAWMGLVADTVQQIHAGSYEKVVLARSVEVMPDPTVGAFNISATLYRLRDSYANASIFAVQHGGRFFIGATPERLVQAEQGKLQTMALAGSLRRGATPAEDELLGLELLQSAKNNNEHSIVVERIREHLAAYCTDIDTSAAPRLFKLKNVQHLQTPITATLKPPYNVLDVIALLHPTPAVGGFPHEAALNAIREREQLDRGWYAAPLGWIDAYGQGEFVVALRSGLIERERATLFAGNGIVAGSDPQSEYAETCWKLQAMLRGLGA